MIELISIHIPKTAGTSFEKVLKSYYGKDVLTLYGSFANCDEYERLIDRHPDKKVLHGHFPLDLIKKRFPEAKKVVWLRDPVERVISYYFHWLRMRPHGNKNHERFIREKQSIVELADLLKDEAEYYLGGDDISDFDFVGIMEFFSDDVKRFESWIEKESGLKRTKRKGKILDSLIPSFGREVPFLNKNAAKKDISEEERKEIGRIMSKEIEHYNKALKSRYL